MKKKWKNTKISKLKKTLQEYKVELPRVWWKVSLIKVSKNPYSKDLHLQQNLSSFFKVSEHLKKIEQIFISRWNINKSLLWLSAAHMFSPPRSIDTWSTRNQLVFDRRKILRFSFDCRHLTHKSQWRHLDFELRSQSRFFYWIHRIHSLLMVCLARLWCNFVSSNGFE